MSRMLEFHKMIENSRLVSEEILKNPAPEFMSESHNSPTGENRLYLGENLHAMSNLIDYGFRGRLDLVYIDPPFFSGSDYRKRISIGKGEDELVFYNDAYKDTWKDGLMDYLGMISTRIFLIRELLSDKGTIYVHVDSRTAHYMRLILDEVFGENRFLNEIIWSYKSGGAGRKSFSKKHDNILVYTKTKNFIFNPLREKSYNRGMKPYRFKNVLEYEDEIGWHTLVNMKDVWNVDMVGRTSSERVGYETQKPEALLQRIVLASSNEGSIVGDFFMGSGTTIKVAEKNGRRWIGADNSVHSVVTCGSRLGDSAGYRLFHNLDMEDSSIDFSVKGNRVGERIGISIEDIRIDQDFITLNSSDPDLAERTLKEKPSKYIDYLGIYRVNIHRECIREWYGPEVETEFEIEDFFQKEDRIVIRLIDIFGNISEKELEV
ncbi:DNA methyltransferase [Gudongella sp. DL1XJH-153]|uniref:DNA methyltransferase n=1 Tax=Gudongella sp. DL1XJH-153 TaxID=3409804 RepID=UPI003BB80715